MPIPEAANQHNNDGEGQNTASNGIQTANGEEEENSGASKVIAIGELREDQIGDNKDLEHDNEMAIELHYDSSNNSSDHPQDMENVSSFLKQI